MVGLARRCAEAVVGSNRIPARKECALEKAGCYGIYVGEDREIPYEWQGNMSGEEAAMRPRRSSLPPGENRYAQLESLSSLDRYLRGPAYLPCHNLSTLTFLSRLSAQADSRSLTTEWVLPFLACASFSSRLTLSFAHLLLPARLKAF